MAVGQSRGDQPQAPALTFHVHDVEQSPYQVATNSSLSQFVAYSCVFKNCVRISNGVDCALKAHAMFLLIRLSLIAIPHETLLIPRDINVHTYVYTIRQRRTL